MDEEPAAWPRSCCHVALGHLTCPPARPRTEDALGSRGRSCGETASEWLMAALNPSGWWAQTGPHRAHVGAGDSTARSLSPPQRGLACGLRGSVVPSA